MLPFGDCGKMFQLPSLGIILNGRIFRAVQPNADEDERLEAVKFAVYVVEFGTEAIVQPTVIQQISSIRVKLPPI